MKKIFFALLMSLAFCSITISQTTLYSEDFTGQNGKGAIGNTIDISGVNWKVDVSGATLNNGGPNSDYFYVINEAFTAKDTDGIAIWFSPSINIAGYINVNFSLDAFTTGNNDPTDTFLAEYRIDGGTWTTAANNGSLNDDFNLEVSQTGLSGNSLEIRIQINTNADNELTTFDKIVVLGTGPVTYTYNNGWLPSDPNGASNSIDIIDIVSGDATISNNTTCNTVTVGPGASLTIDTGVLLTANNLTLESTSSSYSSLILDGSVSGTINYERHVNALGNGNDLISPPLHGQTFGNFATANINIFENPSNTSQKLFGPWDKATGGYLTYDTDVPADANTTLNPGTGYRTASADNSAFTFTGTVNTGTITKDITLSGPPTSDKKKWNLVGNPYPSYLNVQGFLNHEVAPGVKNLQLLETSTAAIYGYDGNVNDGWTIYNLATTTASTVIAPGQGFFVSANAALVAAYDLEFTPAMRATGNSDDFIAGRNAPLSYLKLNLSNNNQTLKTEFYFNPNASRGQDLGYDAAVWESIDPTFSIYSKLVEEDNDAAIALQALNSDDMTDVTIPLGVNANQAEQITFSISESTLPSSIKIYLEDTFTNTTTLLNTGDYSITPTTDLSSTGRFFLRVTEDALSVNENGQDSIKIIALNSTKELIVEGVLQFNSAMTIYDLQGRLIKSSLLDHSMQTNRTDTTELQAGVYIVTVSNNGHTKTQKVVIH